VTACSDGGGKKPTIIPDAPMMQMIDAPEMPANCTLSQMATVTPTMPDAIWDVDPDDTAVTNYYDLFADLNQDAKPDYIDLELYKGFGVFTNGYPTTATTIPLTGDEVNYRTCGACIRVYSDIDTDNMTIAGTYFATAGTLELTQVSETRLAGTLTNLTLTHVDIDDTTFETTAHADGCSTTLASLAFDIVPMQATPAFANNNVGMRIKIRKPTR
jgi:hypothetical protein